MKIRAAKIYEYLNTKFNFEQSLVTDVASQSRLGLGEGTGNIVFEVVFTFFVDIHKFSFKYILHPPGEGQSPPLVTHKRKYCITLYESLSSVESRSLFDAAYESAE